MCRRAGFVIPEGASGSPVRGNTNSLLSRYLQVGCFSWPIGHRELHETVFRSKRRKKRQRFGAAHLIENACVSIRCWYESRKHTTPDGAAPPMKEDLFHRWCVSGYFFLLYPFLFHRQSNGGLAQPVEGHQTEKPACEHCKKTDPAGQNHPKTAHQHADQDQKQ